MNTGFPRVFVTTDDAISRAETALGRGLPPSFRSWLLIHNGSGIGFINIFPVLDSREPHRTCDSIDRRYYHDWADWLINFEQEDRDFGHLIPFAGFGTGDFYCFDCTRTDRRGEAPVVQWCHRTGDTRDLAPTFSEFILRAEAGEFGDA